MDIVTKVVGNKVRVTTNDNRVIVGTLACFDAEGNLFFRFINETLTLSDKVVQREIRNSLIPKHLISKIEVAPGVL